MAKRSFYYFAKSAKISNWQINEWIRLCLEAVKNGAPHHSISSGDTVVIALKYSNEIHVIVANSSGKSDLSFSLSPGFEDPLEFEKYSRDTWEVVRA